VRQKDGRGFSPAAEDTPNFASPNPDRRLQGERIPKELRTPWQAFTLG